MMSERQIKKAAFISTIITVATGGLLLVGWLWIELVEGLRGSSQRGSCYSDRLSLHQVKLLSKKVLRGSLFDYLLSVGALEILERLAERRLQALPQVQDSLLRGVHFLGVGLDRRQRRTTMRRRSRCDGDVNSVQVCRRGGPGARPWTKRLPFSIPWQYGKIAVVRGSQRGEIKQ